MFSQPLKVHCWGGYGSQLFALATALKLQGLLPNRRIQIVFHSSGLTRRTPEIVHLLTHEIDYRFIDDFKPPNTNLALIENRKSHCVRQLLIWMIRLTRLVVWLERDEDFSKISLATREIRGHYSYLRFDESIYLNLFGNIQSQAADFHSNNEACLTIHYRLGDLLTVSKDYIDPTLVKTEISNLVEEHGELNVKVFSDSPKDAERLLNSDGLKFMKNSFLSNSVSLDELITACVSSNFFIGTNSKLSILISIFRYTRKMPSKMPNGLRETLSRLISDTDSRFVQYY
jgi:hypothetical protein